MPRLLVLTVMFALALAAPAAAEFVQDNGSPLQVGFAPYGVAAADLDGNGTPDLAAASATAGTVTVLLRQLNGTWLTDPARSSSGANAIAIGDLDGDGRPDLAVARYPSASADIYMRQANGTFSAPIALAVNGATSVKVALVNGDARPDLVFGSSATDSVYVVLRNVANTGFDPPVPYASTGHKGDLEVADFTGDGRVDIAASNTSGPGSIDLWVQQPNGTFAQGTGFPLNVGTQPIGLAQADFNADGRPDLAVALPALDKVAVLLGQPGGGFASMAGSPFDVGDSPVGVTSADFNRDGVPDLAVANQAGKSISVLLRTATGFANDPSSPIVTGQNATEIATADFNADGKTDLAVANYSSNSVSVLLNAMPNPLPPPLPPPPAPDLDADNDGAQVPLDCRDDDPKIRPGIADIPQDGIDQDCSGADADYPVLNRKVRYAFEVTPGGAIKFTRLQVLPVRAGDVVTLSCTGRGCAFKTRKVSVRKARSTLSLLPEVKRVRLRNKATFIVRVTRSGMIGQYTQLKVKKQDLKALSRCVRPGATKPVRCPES